MPKIPTLDPELLSLLDIKPKDMRVYTALVQLGTAPLRRIATEAGLNRGTTYDALKRLLDLGLVSYVDAKTHRYFTAEDPQKLRAIATQREVAIKEAQLTLQDVVPQFQALLGQSAHRPSVRYYEGESGVREILEDVLATCERSRDKLYRVYSTKGLRDLIADAWPSFIKTRVRRRVGVRTISTGQGGRLHGLDERKWLSQDTKAPSYIFIYPGKTAYIAADERNKLFGVLIDDPAITATQELIFDALWRHL